jgi:hypothetical protein
MAADAPKLCIECKNSLLPYALDDFHHNAQCKAKQNQFEGTSYIDGGKSQNMKAYLCKEARIREDCCGKDAKWFEPRKVEVAVDEQQSASASNTA